MKNLFIAVATGQSVSNFPPILQYAEKGDQVLWLVSKEVEDSLPQVVSVLENRGLKNAWIKVSDLYAAKDIRDAILGHDLLFGHWTSIFFILNGGPKLTPIGLALAGEALSDRAEIVYLHGDVKTFFRRYENLLSENVVFSTGRYERQRMLDLEEILMVAGRKLEAPAKDVWCPASQTVPKNCVGLDPVQFFLESDSAHDGTSFEKAVFCRVVDFLSQSENEPYKYIVKEVVLGATLMQGPKIEAEFDVAIVLLNGTVLHLECKSGKKKLKVKDIQSRILALERAVSRISKLYVVVPLIPEKYDDDNFKDRLYKWEELKAVTNFKSVAFTNYTRSEQVCFKKNSGEIKVEPFENKLISIFSGFLPRG